jgi:hypothetical protein
MLIIGHIVLGIIAGSFSCDGSACRIALLPGLRGRSRKSVA